MTISVLLGCAGLVSRALAQDFDGRYLGSLVHNDAPGTDTNDLLNLLDVTNRSMLARRIDLNLGASLRYEAELWAPRRSFTDTDILRSRFFGDVRSSEGRTAWRLHGQVVPWQRLRPTPDIPRRRDVQVGLDFTPLHLPQLSVNFTRAERETPQGFSSSEDRRAELRFARGGFATNLGARRIDTEVPGNAAGTRTNEFRAGVLGSGSWRSVSWNGAYDALALDTEMRERDTSQLTQNVNAGAVWAPHRKFTLSGNGLTRWLRTEDKARPAPDETRELYFNVRADTRPVTGLSVGLLREYRESTTSLGEIVADYLRLETLYQRDVVRHTLFQTGWLQTFDLRSEGGGLPQNSAFALVDGQLRRNVGARAELRFATTEPVSTGLQWRALLQLRTRPSRRTQFDALWHQDQLPEIEGEQQRDRSLELVAGYQPSAATSLIGTHRRLDGEGRIVRAERFWSLNGSWRTSQYTTFSLYASARSTRLRQFETEETTVGLELSWWIREQSRLRGTLRQVRGIGESRSYGVTLTRNF